MNIEFIHQKKFDGCKSINSLIFDFFIPDKNLCIEFNGSQHYKISEYFGGSEGFKNGKKRDRIKKKYCKDNNIRLRTITYRNNIANKLLQIINEENRREI